jgi:hypothetical protein
MRLPTLTSATLALALLGALPAGAQSPADKNPSDNDLSTENQGTAQDKYRMSLSQQRDMMQTLRNQQTQNAPSGFDGRVGSKVPNSMSTRPLPDEATAQAPQVKGLLFVHLPDRVLLIDPDEKAIVEIVPDDATTGSGAAHDSNSGAAETPGGQPGSDSGDK